MQLLQKVINLNASLCFSFNIEGKKEKEPVLRTLHIRVTDTTEGVISRPASQTVPPFLDNSVLK